MIDEIQELLGTKIQALVLADGTHPFTVGETPEEGNVFFGELPRDFLKDNDYAAQLLSARDRTQREGRTIGRQRNEDCTAYTITKRLFTREIICRCFLYAPLYDDLWGKAGYVGLVDQLVQSVAETRAIADGDNNVIRVDMEDAVRPWNTDTAADRQKRGTHTAIVRVRFKGGIHKTSTVPIIGSVEFSPRMR